jgi:formylglycine-generating enzyme required for sulfatase activity
MLAWYSRNSQDKRTAGGWKAPNAFGLYDMLGNVQEWVADWYDDKYYQQKPAIDPRGPSLTGNRVARGGAWNSDPEDVRVSRRDFGDPVNRFGTYGFRCAGQLS